MAASSRASSSSSTPSTSMTAFRSYMKITEPCSAIFPFLLFTHAFTSAVARLSLSVKTEITKEAPPNPYTSNVFSWKSPVLPSVAFLMALAMLSTGTEFALACLTISANIRFALVSAEPPCLTAMMILFPKTAFTFAFFPSVLDFVFSRTAAARPMKRAKSGEVSRVGTPRSDGREGRTPIKPHTSCTNNRENATTVETAIFLMVKQLI
mmetsp:Transcript_18558/g.23897  ORF Transcript_18558/g.23897 Transcript_18558/m.23897 type:complete len:209 (+) Transcript_18558:506-1132(+)